MGRNAGWLALRGGECSDAYIILIPEYPFDMEKVCELLRQRHGREINYSIIVVAEAAMPVGGQELLKDNHVDDFGHESIGGIASYVATEIARKTGFESRHIILSYLQRGGSPSSHDRLMARWFGTTAVDMIINEDFGRMVSLVRGEITSIPLKEIINKLNLVDVKKYYDTERYNGRRTIF
jgi:6-phosphofructokinase 1